MSHSRIELGELLALDQVTKARKSPNCGATKARWCNVVSRSQIASPISAAATFLTFRVSALPFLPPVGMFISRIASRRLSPMFTVRVLLRWM